MRSGRNRHQPSERQTKTTASNNLTDFRPERFARGATCAIDPYPSNAHSSTSKTAQTHFKSRFSFCCSLVVEWSSARTGNHNLKPAALLLSVSRRRRDKQSAIWFPLVVSSRRANEKYNCLHCYEKSHFTVLAYFRRKGDYSEMIHSIVRTQMPEAVNREGGQTLFLQQPI